MIFNENPSSGSRVVPCRITDRETDRQTDMTKLKVAFRNTAKAPNSMMKTKKSKNARKFTQKDTNELNTLRTR